MSQIGTNMNRVPTVFGCLIIVACAKKESPVTSDAVTAAAVTTTASAASACESLQAGGAKREIILEGTSQTYCLSGLQLKRGALMKDLVLPKDCLPSAKVSTGESVYECASGYDLSFAGPVQQLGKITIRPAGGPAAPAAPARCDETLQPGSAKREIDLDKDTKSYCVGAAQIKPGVLYKDIAASLPKDCVKESKDGETVYRSPSGVDFHFGGPNLKLSRVVIHPKG
jgi:hypothetical protein